MASGRRVALLACLLQAAAVLGLRSMGSQDARQPTLPEVQDIREECRAPLYKEPGRPQFHFTPAKNWMNDPTGLVYYDGEYHLFFQHNPYSRHHGNMTWGHAVSADLLHWTQLEHAILPDGMGDIWSGSSVVDWKNTSGLQAMRGMPPLVAYYTNRPRTGEPFSQRLAFSNDRGRTWERLPYPSIVNNVSSAMARDPKIIWHEATGQWIMALSMGEGMDGTFGLFASRDLRSWRQIQTLSLKGSYNECPDFFEMPLRGGGLNATRFVFLTALGAYVVGEFDGKSFTPTGPMRNLEFGQSYAGSTFSNEPQGRQVQLAWMGWGKAALAFSQEPFTGQMTVPMELELVARPDGPRLLRRPASELGALRRAPLLLGLKRTPLARGEERAAEAHAAGAGLEARLQVRGVPAGGNSHVTLQLLGQEVHVWMSAKATTCHFTPGTWAPHVDMQCSAVASVGSRVLPLQPNGDGIVEITVLVDRRSVEVFDGWGGASLAVLASLPCDRKLWSRRASVRTVDGTAEIQGLQVYELKSALPAQP